MEAHLPVHGMHNRAAAVALVAMEVIIHSRMPTECPADRAHNLAVPVADMVMMVVGEDPIFRAVLITLQVVVEVAQAELAAMSAVLALVEQSPQAVLA
jgi:hypothetical protein